MKSTRSNTQYGAVSLFVVIFATLLITVVTVSFLRLMISDQNRATSNDLSQSAYDSAQAGVEDAKRVLLRYQKICNEGGQSACDFVASQINDVACNDALRVGDVIGSSDVANGGGAGTGEIKIQQTSSSAGDATLDQAYTCVTINLLTDDYVGSLSAGQSKLVPLIGKSADGTTDFDTVKVEWFTTEDIGRTASGSYAINLPGVAASQPLLPQANWATNRPPVLRTQLMQFGDNFTLSSFDAVTASNESNGNTLFLYPTSAVTASSETFTSRDQRKTTGDTPQKTRTDTPLPVTCVASLSSGGYACSQTLRLPNPISGGDRTAFLRLTPLYNATHFRVSLSKNSGNNAVQFNGVQPEIDSTGRANDLFRRVSSRVDLIDTSFPYPDGAVDISGNLCKDFSVTASANVTPGGSTCTP